MRRLPVRVRMGVAHGTLTDDGDRQWPPGSGAAALLNGDRDAGGIRDRADTTQDHVHRNETSGRHALGNSHVDLPDSDQAGRESGLEDIRVVHELPREADSGAVLNWNRRCGRKSVGRRTVHRSLPRTE